eukprot:TRINITY_DN2823_c0_g4_i1.p1 TRINITY_DN2823_c0_g4~~TRINITY_DN2823_c0_g4_i1.p1  ORF type:complete len:307 (+),score=71.21 TRINITY_DN2823_c0_g4_i1:167-1087(+)
MPSVKVRKQQTLVNACRRRLKRMQVENGEVPSDAKSSKGANFSVMVEELKQCMDGIGKMKVDVDKVAGKSNGDAARVRNEFNSEIQRARTILTAMGKSLVNLRNKVDAAERKGGKKTETEKHISRKKELRSKEDLITNMNTELEKLEWKPEYEMNKADASNLDQADLQLRAIRRRQRGDVMKETSDGGEGGPAQPDEDYDEEFEKNQKLIENRRIQQEQILTRISRGLGTLKEQAINIGHQIDASNARVEDLEERAEKTQTGLRALNKSALRALESANSNSFFTNVACFLVLIALSGVAVYYLDLV